MCVVDAWSTDVAVQRRDRNVLKLSIREKEAWRSFTGEGGLEDDSSSRSGGWKSGNGFSPRKRTGQGHFFLKKFQLRLAVLVRNGATANGRFHSRIFCYVGLLAEI